MKKKIYIFLSLCLTFSLLEAQGFRIDPSVLSKDLSKYKIVDTRAAKLYKKGHIKAALNFPIDFSYVDKKNNGKLIEPEQMQKILRTLGLKREDQIVIYDDGKFFDAARLFWAFEVYGFTNIKILNGGYTLWKEEKLGTSIYIDKVKKSNYISSINSQRLATKFSTLIATKSPRYVILDARDLNAYNGEVSSAKRYGHIRKAKHFPASHNIDYKDSLAQLKTTRDLKKLYKNINPKSKVIVYCAIGLVASVNYFALRELGYDVANYDASWKEWGNDFNLPIVNPSK